MIRHVVFAKFKAPLDSEVVATFIREVDSIPQINREVQNWVSGLSPEPRFHNGDYHWGFTCDLADWAAMDRYMWHEAHLRQRPFALAAVEHLHSFDFEIDFVAETNAGAVAPEAVEAVDAHVVPGVRGKTVEHAVRLIEAAGLAVNPEMVVVRGTVWADGRITGVEPAAGTAMAAGGVVTLSVAADELTPPKL